jgi:hypothetical protein
LYHIPAQTKFFCYSPSRDQLAITSYFSHYELPNTLYKIICERSKQLGKVEALVVDGCHPFEIFYFSVDDPTLMFRGLFNFHGLKQVSYIAGHKRQWRDPSKRNFSKFFDDGFEWEKRGLRVQEAGSSFLQRLELFQSEHEFLKMET